MERRLLLQTELLLDRLERISADSPWAHQASGIRASLARQLADAAPSPTKVQSLMRKGFEILEKAASQIPAEDNQEEGGSSQAADAP